MKALFALIAAVAFTAPALANQELAGKKNCLACHAVDKKVVGPSYKDVAARYAGQAGAEATLTTAIQKGSKGVFGEVAMPPNPAVKPDEAARLAKWVLSLK